MNGRTAIDFSDAAGGAAPIVLTVDDVVRLNNQILSTTK
jgi:hypothetical protein